MARSQALDLVANNLANTSTPGYRGQQNIFRSFLATAAGHPGSQLNQAVNDFGISGGSQMADRAIWNTGNDLDFAVRAGFFEAKTANGSVYTRRKFQVSAKQLTTAQGDRLWVIRVRKIVGGP
jgi:flagellar basal body rod protein FlgG